MGKTGLDLKGSDVDGASFSAHKINGPRGVGLLYAKNPELFSEFVDNIENNDYLIGAKVNVKYNFGENSCGSRLAKDQDEVRIQLLEPWIKKGEISYNPFVLEESEVNPVMKIPAEERSLFSIGIGFH